MEELTRLQASQQAFHTHMTRIFNKVEETLASELTYLNTAINQLEKEQIIKLDTQITELLKDAPELEESIMESEELQDTILEKMN